MHPIDDMMLGKIIKEHGYHQDCLLGQDFVVVPWYDSVRAMVNGLLKNMFAVVHYRLLCIPLMILAILVGSIFPFWGVIWGDIPVRNVCLVTIGVRLVSFGYGLKNQGLPIWYLPGAVISPYISCYIILKSACVTLYNGGISWRGQHYPLRELKKAKPLLF